MLIEQPADSIMLFAKSFGFHFKKILFPWPQSFTITDVSAVYIWVGMALALWCVLLFLFDRSLPASLFISGTLFLVPAWPVALGYIAWTPFAERYAYVASALVILASMVLLGKTQASKSSLIPSGIILVCILMVFGASTTLRASLWSDDVAFFADTVEKNPKFYKVRYAYGNALMEDKQYRAAEEQYRQALALQKDEAENKFFLYMGVLRTWEKRYIEAKPFFEQAVVNYKDDALILSYDKLAWVLNTLVREDLSADKDALHVDLLKVNLKLYELKRDPFFLYRAGQSALALNRDKEARQYFAEAQAKLPSNSIYKSLAEKLMNKL
jgi:hypothetical protein